jgi:hypothetical protein
MGVADYLGIAVDHAFAQWRQVLARMPLVDERGQVAFLPIETLM